MTSPRDLLQAAADRIRDLAAAATPGRWEARAFTDEDTTYTWTAWWVEAEGDDQPKTSGGSIASMDHLNRENDARWIAALSPAVSAPLEAVLRAAAHDVTVSGMVLARLLCPELAQERVQCSNAVHNLSLSAPERCALEEGHEGTCEP